MPYFLSAHIGCLEQVDGTNSFLQRREVFILQQLHRLCFDISRLIHNEQCAPCNFIKYMFESDGMAIYPLGLREQDWPVSLSRILARRTKLRVTARAFMTPLDHTLDMALRDEYHSACGRF